MPNPIDERRVCIHTAYMPVERRQKNVMFTLDEETQHMLRDLADRDETQPGNRSNVVRRLIREAWRLAHPGKNPPRKK
jgi:hypothetical protein